MVFYAMKTSRRSEDLDAHAISWLHNDTIGVMVQLTTHSDRRNYGYSS